MKERAKRDLAENGITREQRKAYLPCVSELIYKGIVPAGYLQNYQETSTIIKDIVNNLLKDRRDVGSGEHRENAWRFYLGLPQQGNTFGISNYRPSKSTEGKYYYNIPVIVEEFRKPSYWNGISYITPLKHLAEGIELYGGSDQKLQVIDNYALVMGTFTISKSQDER